MYITLIFFFFFFNDTATTEIYTLSLHDALPIFPHARGALAALPDADRRARGAVGERGPQGRAADRSLAAPLRDRKSTRLNSSHSSISYAVFCLKKKKKNTDYTNSRDVKRT